MKVVGFYNEHGYRICTVDDTGQVMEELLKNTGGIKSLAVNKGCCVHEGIMVAAEYNVQQGLKGDLMVEWDGVQLWIT